MKLSEKSLLRHRRILKGEHTSHKLMTLENDNSKILEPLYLSQIERDFISRVLSHCTISVDSEDFCTKLIDKLESID